MLVAHWINLNPRIAPAQFSRHQRLQEAILRAELFRVGIRDAAKKRAAVPRAELAALKQEFAGQHHWTKLTVPGLKDAVKGEFPEEESHRRLLEQVHGILHRYSNLTVHHSYLSLEAAAPRMPDGHFVADVGATPTLIPQALFILFFSYLHLITLYLPDDAKQQEAARLWHAHRAAFTTGAEPEVEEPTSE